MLHTNMFGIRTHTPTHRHTHTHTHTYIYIYIIKQSSHKSFYNVAEAYKKDRTLYPSVLIFGTTNMHLPLDPNCLLGLYFVTFSQI